MQGTIAGTDRAGYFGIKKPLIWQFKVLGVR